MASLTQRVDVAFTIPIEKTPEVNTEGQLQYAIRANITKTKRFFKQLQKLCKKYGYTIGEIQPAKESTQ